MAGFLTAAAAALGGNSIVGSVVRIMIAYGISRLINKNTGRDPGTRAPIDEGVRLQLAPNTTNSIPALVGSAFYGGAITDARLTNNNQTMWYAITLSEVFGFRIGDVSYGIYFNNVYWNGQRVVFKSDGVTVDYVVNDDGVVDASPRDLVKIYLYTNGSANNTTLRDPETNAILPSITSFSAQDARSLMPGWTNDHRMSNLTFALVRMDYNRDKGITGLPDVQFNVRNELYRPGDAIYAYMRSGRVGAGFTPTTGANAGLIGTGRIDSTSLTALNDYADDDIAYIDSDGTTKTLADRYQINGLIDTNRPVLENLELLTQACGSFLNYDIANGLWGVIVNRNTSPVLAFDDTNIISGIQVSGTGLDALYNGVQYQFPHRQIRDKSDFITVDLPDEYRNTREPDNVLRLQTELFNEPLQARQLAYLELYQNRMDQVITFTTDYSKINTEAGDVITVTNDVYDWNAKQFRVIRVKEVESEEGGIAVEITAQEYDGTMYDAGGQPRRPGVPSTAIAIPTLGAIAKPLAPTVLTTNNQNATPSITLRSTVPGSTQANTAVIVDRMEFWYVAGAANTATSLYKLAEISQNANGNPFTTGSNQDSQPIIGLPGGTYQFRVRAGNSESFSEYSDPVQLVWDPKQRTDQVDENTQFVPEDPDLLDILGPLAMGALAYYAYKALAPQILESLGLTDLAKLLGLDPNAPDLQQQIDAIKTKAGGFTTVDVQGGGLVDSGVSTALRFIAGNGIEITATQGIEAGEITIAATGAGGGFSFNTIAVAGQSSVVADISNDTVTFVAGDGISITTNASTDVITFSTDNSTGPIDNGLPDSGSVNLCGSIFPNLYQTSNVASKQAIFTHEYLAFSTSTYNGNIRLENLVDPESLLSPNFTNSTTVYRYYAYCDYNPSIDICDQNWSNWRLWRDPTYETNTITTPDGSTNPFPTVADYCVDDEYNCGGVGLKNITTNQEALDYNYFLPDNAKFLTNTTTSVTIYQDVKAQPGRLVIFGLSRFNFPDNTPFQANTILGKRSNTQVTITQNVNSTVSASRIITNGSTYVVSDETKNNQLFYSTDPTLQSWKKVKNVTFENSSVSSDVSNVSSFRLLPYKSSLGKFYAYATHGNDGTNSNEICSSTDGINWTEHNESIPGRPKETFLTTAGYFVTNNGYYALDPLLGWTAFSSGIVGDYFVLGNNEFVFVSSLLFKSTSSLTDSNIVNFNLLDYESQFPGGSYIDVGPITYGNGKYCCLLIRSEKSGNLYFNQKKYILIFNGRFYNNTISLKVLLLSSTSNPTTTYPTITFEERPYYDPVYDKFLIPTDQGYKILTDNTNPMTLSSSISGETNARMFRIGNTRYQIKNGTIYYGSEGNSQYSNIVTTITYENVPIGISTEYCFPGAQGNNPIILRVPPYGVDGNTCVNYIISWSLPTI